VKWSYLLLYLMALTSLSLLSLDLVKSSIAVKLLTVNSNVLLVKDGWAMVSFPNRNGDTPISYNTYTANPVLTDTCAK